MSNKNKLNEIKKVKDMEKLLKEQGFSYNRTAGSHAIWTKPGCTSASVPCHGNEIARGTARDILKAIFGQNYRDIE
jgi:predicted RNA binding protein YcfA (HicA-like mRNA interferase family)